MAANKSDVMTSGQEGDLQKNIKSANAEYERLMKITGKIVEGVGLEGDVESLPPEKYLAALNAGISGQEEYIKEKREDIIDNLENGGDYSIEKKRKYIYVCKNNGQFHTGNAAKIPGYATFIGKFSIDEFLEWAKQFYVE